MKDSRKFRMHWNNYRYRKEADGIVIEEYEGEELHIVIPSEIEGYDLLFIILLIKSKRGCPISGQPLVLLHLKVINTADQLICDLA